MPRRRARLTVALAAALAATASAHAQDAGAPALRPSLGTPAEAPPAGPAPRPPTIQTPFPTPPPAGDEPLRRLDTLAGGDYAAPDGGALAGGGYGRDLPRLAGDDGAAAGAGAAATLAIGDPLARRGQPRLSATGLRRLPAPTADDPYAPEGIRAGSFILRPTLETAGGYDTNPERDSVGVKASKFLRLRGDLDASSDWSRHELQVRLSGQIRKYVDQSGSGLEPDGTAIVTGRFDVAERTQVITELRSSITTSRPGDPETPDEIDGDEIERSFGATLGVAQRFNRFSLRLDGLIDRYLYDDSRLLDGTKVDNGDRVYNAYEVRLRAAYELSPRLAPFAEIAVDTRDYDRARDEDGRELGSNGYALRAGARFEATRLITGELAVGYGRQTPKDGSLDAAGGLLLDGSVAWAPTALTTVRFNAKSALEETTLENSGGVLTRAVGLAVDHALRRNLILTARADFERSEYKGIGRTDDTVVLGLEGEYRLNRSVALIGSLEHERQNSSVAGESYSAAIIEFGLRFRR